MRELLPALWRALPHRLHGDGNWKGKLRNILNCSLDVSFGFEEHFLRGLKKMKLKFGPAVTVMPAMAVRRIRENQNELMRSLGKSAAWTGGESIQGQTRGGGSLLPSVIVYHDR